jgi:hypothetical protein
MIISYTVPRLDERDDALEIVGGARLMAGRSNKAGTLAQRLTEICPSFVSSDIWNVTVSVVDASSHVTCA